MANQLDVMASFRKIAAAAAALTICGMSQLVCAGGNQTTGTVVDQQTKAPLAGAYVLAVYHQARVVGGVLQGSSCVKTLGMYTGPDGRFSFPLERLDGLSPNMFATIAPGYYSGVPRRSDGSAWKNGTAKDYADIQIFMLKQDPNHPVYQYSSGDEYCDHAPTPKDNAAGTEFMRAELREMIHFGASSEVIDDLRKTIAQREARERGGK